MKTGKKTRQWSAVLGLLGGSQRMIVAGTYWRRQLKLASDGVRAFVASACSEVPVEEALPIQAVLPATMWCDGIQYSTSRQCEEARCFGGTQCIHQCINRLLNHRLLLEMSMSVHFRSSFSEKATSAPDQMADCTREHGPSSRSSQATKSALIASANATRAASAGPKPRTITRSARSLIMAKSTSKRWALLRRADCKCSRPISVRDRINLNVTDRRGCQKEVFSPNVTQDQLPASVFKRIRIALWSSKGRHSEHTSM